MRAGVKNSGKSVTEILINENHMKLFDGRRRHEEHRHHAADLFRAAAVVAAGLAHGARRMAVQPPGNAAKRRVLIHALRVQGGAPTPRILFCFFKSR